MFSAKLTACVSSCACLRVCLHVCVIICAPTGFKGGALCSHAPRAGAASFGHHDRELVQCVGLQARHHVVQAGGVGHLGRETHTHTRTQENNTNYFLYLPLIF